MANKEFTQVLVDTAMGKVVNYSKDDANSLIRKEFAKVLGIDENETNPATIRRAFRRNKADVYTLIEVAVEELMVSGWGDNPFFRQMVEERNIALGDRNVFYVPDNSILTCSRVAGDHHDLIRQKLGMGQEFNVNVNTYAIKIYDEFVRFQAGRIDWAQLIAKIYESADQKVNDMLYDAFMGLDKVVPTELKYTGSLTADKILEMADRVQAGTGHEVMLVGTRGALSKAMNLVNAGWVSAEMKDQRNTTGMIANFEGIETMVIPPVYKKNKRESAYANDTIYVLPKVDNKPIKLVWEGDTMFTESTTSDANVDMTVEAEYQFRMGIATVVGYDFAVIKVSE